MKKLMVALSVVVLGAATAKADFLWNWWTTSNEDKPQKTEMRGCSLGIASQLKEVSGAQIDLLFNKNEKFNAGCQYAIGYSQTLEMHNGVQVATVNKAKSASLQIGLVCINDTGFLPFFIFFNFDPHMFGGAK